MRQEFDISQATTRTIYLHFQSLRIFFNHGGFAPQVRWRWISAELQNQSIPMCEWFVNVHGEIANGTSRTTRGRIAPNHMRPC
jgi:hypothetical protein